MFECVLNGKVYTVGGSVVSRPSVSKTSFPVQGPGATGNLSPTFDPRQCDVMGSYVVSVWSKTPGLVSSSRPFLVVLGSLFATHVIVKNFLSYLGVTESTTPTIIFCTLIKTLTLFRRLHQTSKDEGVSDLVVTRGTGILVHKFTHR